MKIFVQGLWHCGCVISACLSSLKHKVIAYDDNKKIITKLKKNITPIFDPNLKYKVDVANFHSKSKINQLLI